MHHNTSILTWFTMMWSCVLYRVSESSNSWRASNRLYDWRDFERERALSIPLPGLLGSGDLAGEAKGDSVSSSSGPRGPSPSSDIFLLMYPSIHPPPPPDSSSFLSTMPNRERTLTMMACSVDASSSNLPPLSSLSAFATASNNSTVWRRSSSSYWWELLSVEREGECVYGWIDWPQVIELRIPSEWGCSKNWGLLYPNRWGRHRHPSSSLHTSPWFESLLNGIALKGRCKTINQLLLIWSKFINYNYKIIIKSNKI